MCLLLMGGRPEGVGAGGGRGGDVSERGGGERGKGVEKG